LKITQELQEFPVSRFTGNLQKLYDAISYQERALFDETPPPVEGGPLYPLFQRYIQDKNLKMAARILTQMEERSSDPDQELYLPVCRLDLALLKIEQGQKIKEQKISALWNQALQGALIFSPLSHSLSTGILINTNLEKRMELLFQKYKKNLSLKTKLTIIATLPAYTNWQKTISAPPGYYSAPEKRIRFLHTTQWFSQADGLRPSYKLAPKVEAPSPRCRINSLCWVLYPFQNQVYSVLYSGQGQTRVHYESMVDSNGLFLLTQKFYSALAQKNQNFDWQPHLQRMGELFTREIEVIRSFFQKLDVRKKEVHLFLSGYLHSLPVESLDTGNARKSPLGVAYTIRRKLPKNALFEYIACPMVQCTRQEKEDRSSRPPLPAFKNHFFLGISRHNTPDLFGLQGEGDEVVEIENLFTEKELFAASTKISSQMLSGASRDNLILHVAGGWNFENNEPQLIISSPNYKIPIATFEYSAQIPYIVFSRQEMVSLHPEDFTLWDHILTAFHYKNTQYMITSMALTPKEFRQALFYDFYYKFEHKSIGWPDALDSARERTSKRFADTPWPWLVVLYEKQE
jgi:hypothetical protein